MDELAGCRRPGGGNTSGLNVEEAGRSAWRGQGESQPCALANRVQTHNVTDYQRSALRQRVSWDHLVT